MRRAPILLVLLLTACSLVVGPERTDSPVELKLAASRTDIVPGDTVRLTATLANRTDEPLVLHFSSGCQILPYIRSSAGTLVEPDGGWVCAAVLTSLEIAPGGTHTTTSVWTGERRVYASSAPSSTQPLPPGEYRAQAVLVENSRTGEIRSNEVVLRIR